MNTPLFVTWAVLAGSASLALISVTASSIRKNTNKLIALTAAISLGCSMLVIPFFANELMSAVAALLTVYMLMNAIVLFAWKYHALRTRRVVRTNQFFLLLLATLILGLLYLNPDVLDELLALSGLILSGWILLKVLRIVLNGQQYALEISHGPKSTPNKTVSFAIPARNETHALTQHLQSVLDTDYQKIEFLVIDDCSQDKTAQIIRSFSHDGVRFLKGELPHGNWVGKTHAYEQLRAEANGEYIIFSGVDTRYEPDSIRKIIGFMEDKSLSMISIMPGQVAHVWTETIIQPFRYLGMMIKSSKRYPATLSTVWVVKRDFLNSLGGLEGYKNSLVPEMHIAQAARENNSYAFVVDGGRFGVTSRKRFASQYDTAVRSLYPMLKRSLANHFMVSVAVLLVIVYPLAHLVIEPSHYALLTLLIAYTTYILVVVTARQKLVLSLSPLHFIAGVVYYYYLSIVSIIRYEQNKILWKDRNVCEPVISRTNR